MALPNSKTRILHVARRQLGLDDDAYRDVLFNAAGVRSAKDLDGTGFDLVMRRFAELGFQSTSRRKPLAARRDMASPAQVQLIRELWAQFTDGQGDDRSFGKWLDGRFKVSSIRFVSRDLAPKVIGALKAMVAKRAAPPAAPGGGRRKRAV